MMEANITNLEKTEGINFYRYDYFYEGFKFETVILKRTQESKPYETTTFLRTNKGSWRFKISISKVFFEYFKHKNIKQLLSYIAEDTIRSYTR